MQVSTSQWSQLARLFLVRQAMVCGVLASILIAPCALFGLLVTVIVVFEKPAVYWWLPLPWIVGAAVIWTGIDIARKSGRF